MQLRGCNSLKSPSGVKRFSMSTNNNERTDESKKQLSVFARFKEVYKEYGKSLIAVHIVTSILWYGGFYVIAYSGIDLMPLLVQLGASEAIQAKFETAGDLLVAYILYEIAKPVRYGVTLFGTQQTVKFLRKKGYIPELKPEDRLRSLAKEGKDNLKDKYHERKDDLKDKYHDKKDDFRESYEERKADMKRRWEEGKTKVSTTKEKSDAKRPPSQKNS